MATSGLRAIDHSVHTTNIWLNEIMEELHTEDRQDAWQALRAALHALRDRLSVDESAHFAAQLPLIVRGAYYESWRPAGKPEKIRDLQEFLAKVQAELPNEQLHRDPERVLRAVLRTVSQHVTGGELDEVKQSLPLEIRRLWPESAPVV